MAEQKSNIEKLVDLLFTDPADVVNPLESKVKVSEESDKISNTFNYKAKDNTSGGKISPDDKADSVLKGANSGRRTDEDIEDIREKLVKTAREDPYSDINKQVHKGSEETNINSMSHAKTLRLQRLLDAYNNKYYRQGRRINDQSIGQGGVRLGNTADFGELYKYKADTEEARQMDALRKAGSEVLSKDVERQAAAKGIGAEAAREAAKAKTGVIQSEVAAMFNENAAKYGYQLDYNRMLDSMYIMHEGNNLKLYLEQFKMPAAHADLIRNVSSKDPTTGQLLTGLINIGLAAPSQSQILAAQAIYSKMLEEATAGKSGLDLYKDLEIMQAEAGTETALGSTIAMLKTFADTFMGLANGGSSK